MKAEKYLSNCWTKEFTGFSPKQMLKQFPMTMTLSSSLKADGCGNDETVHLSAPWHPLL